jgi:hypothetical protein
MQQPKEALVVYQMVLEVASGRRIFIGGAAEATRIAGMSSKLHEIRGISFVVGSIASEHLPPMCPQRAGKFSGEVELFYLEFVQQFVETKHFRIGLVLATSYGRGGGRTEDPFRGLRAGPVRYSPFFISRWHVTRHAPRNVTESPQTTKIITGVCPPDEMDLNLEGRNDRNAPYKVPNPL